MSEPKKTGLDLLRVPFPENQISKLPKPMKKREEMDKLPKSTCKVCGQYHATSMVLHLDYVGHAALTDRLLDADPGWSWKPMSLDAMGYPAIDKDGGMWIELTVCGVTRLGYGDAQGKSGGDAMKERIGDALRNAAMRFGAALDLWHKGDLHTEEPPLPEEKPEPAPDPPQSPPQAPAIPEGDKDYMQRVKSALRAIYGDDKDSALAKVEELSFIPAKGTYKATPGVRDYTKLSPKRLEILCHNLEKLVPKKEAPPLTDSCPHCGGNHAPSDGCDICQECGSVKKDGACRSASCPEGKPE